MWGKFCCLALTVALVSVVTVTGNGIGAGITGEDETDKGGRSEAFNFL